MYFQKEMSKLSYSEQSDEEINKFVKRLPLLKMNEINFTFYEMLPLCGVGPTIAFSRFLTLNRKVIYGARALTNAYIRNHKDLWDNEIDDSLLIRCIYFENAIEAYNKVIDYIYIILYFNFKLYEKLDNIGKINTKNDIIDISKKVRGKKKLAKIDDWLRLNELNTYFATEFNAYKLLVKEIRELANDIKHRGCVAVEDIALSRNTKVTQKIDGQDMDITELVSEVKINLDVEIEKLVKIHKHTIEIQKSLYKSCNFQKQLRDFLDKSI